MQSENSRTVRAVLDFQHPLLPFQVFLVQQGRGDGAGFDEVARLAGVVVVGALLVGQLVLGDELAFQFQEVVHGGAVRVFDEEDAAGYGVAVVVQAEVEPFEQVGKVVHGQLQVDGGQGQLGRLAFVEEDIGILVVAVTNSSRYGFNRCKSTTCKFLSRDTKSARDKNGTKPRKNKVKNTSPEISLVEYLCFVCKGTNLSLEKRGEIPISLIHNSFSYHCTPNVVIASDFDLKRLGLRKLGVKFCFALCWTFSKTRTGNRTKDLPPLLSNTWFCECLNDRHLKMLNFK